MEGSRTGQNIQENRNNGMDMATRHDPEEPGGASSFSGPGETVRFPPAEPPPKTMTRAQVGTTGNRWLSAALGLGGEGSPCHLPSSSPSLRAFPPTWSLFLSSRTGQGWFLVWALGHWLLSGVIPAESLAEALNRIPWA